MSIDIIITALREKASSFRGNEIMPASRCAVILDGFADQLSACRTAEAVAWLVSWQAGPGKRATKAFTEAQEDEARAYFDWRNFAPYNEALLTPLYAHPAKAVPEGEIEATAEWSQTVKTRVSEIEDAITSGQMKAPQVFTQMRQLIARAQFHFEAGEFYRKHATGSLLAPSCFGCGGTWMGEEGATRHLELPDIFLCAKCADAIKNTHPAPVASRVTVDEAMVKGACVAYNEAQADINGCSMMALHLSAFAEPTAMRAALEAALTTPERGKVYCAACEQMVSGPCQSIDCSTPESK